MQQRIGPFVALSLWVSQQALADNHHYYYIPAQSLNNALMQFAAESDLKLLFTADKVRGLSAEAVEGDMTPIQALERLLQGSGIRYRFVDPKTLTLEVLPGFKKTANHDTSSESTIITEQTMPKITVKADKWSVLKNTYANPSWDTDPYNPDYYRPNASTATKTDTPILETPASIQVLPQQLLKDQQAIGLENALKNVSGVQQTWGGGQYDSFLLRGFPTLEHFRNGIRLPEHTIDMANVERVEILKGPAAMLYGRIDPGGMINVVTKRPLFTPYYSLQQQFGSYELFRTTLDATGPIAGFDTLAYRFNLSYLDSGSFRDSVNRDRFFMAPSLTWKPNNKTEFNLSFEYRDENVPFDSGLPALNGRVIDVPIDRNLNQPMQQDHIESKLVDFNWSHRFNEYWKIQNGVAAQLIDYEFRELPTATFQTRFSPEDPYLRRGVYFEDFSRDMQTVYLNLTGKFNTWGIKHSVLIGGDYYNKETRNGGFAGFAGTDEQREQLFTFVNVYDPVTPAIDINAINQLRIHAPNDFGRIEESWFGLYFQDQITLWDKLHILGGGRQDWARNKSAYGSSPIASNDLTVQNTEYFSPRVGILYQPWNWLSVYGNYIESFGLNNGRTDDNTPLPPETATNYEAGIKTALYDGRLTANLAYFHLTKQNVKTLLALDSLNYGTIGEARSQGIELDINGQIYDGLNLIASYAFTDAHITKNNDGNEGHRLPNAPEHAASLWLKYAFQQSILRGFNLGTGVYMASNRQADIENTLDLPGYARWDAFAAYTMNISRSKLTTQLNVNNILDKRYYYNGDGQVFGATANNNLPGEPLTFMGSIKLEY